MTRTHQLLGTLGIKVFFLGALNVWQCVERVAVRGTRRTRRAEVHRLTEYLLHKMIHPHKSSLEYCPVNSLSPQLWQRLQLNLYQPHLSVSSSYVLEQVLEVNWWELTFNVAAHSWLSRTLSRNQDQHFSLVLQICLLKGLEKVWSASSGNRLCPGTTWPVSSLWMRRQLCRKKNQTTDGQ